MRRYRPRTVRLGSTRAECAGRTYSTTRAGGSEASPRGKTKRERAAGAAAERIWVSRVTRAPTWWTNVCEFAAANGAIRAGLFLPRVRRCLSHHVDAPSARNLVQATPGKDPKKLDEFSY